MNLPKRSDFPAQRPDRGPDIEAFLKRVGWEEAKRAHLAGDASFRRYERVHYGDKQAVLMDAPPPWEDVKPFIEVTTLLRSFGLHAPNIEAADETAGFLLLEDLGDASFTRVLKQAVERENELYEAAVSALVRLQKASHKHPSVMQLAPYDDAVYLREVALFSDWFMPQIVGIEKARALRDDFLAIWSGVLVKAGLQRSVLVHRDYHADNLLWLADHDDVMRVGMIDYQDALLGDALYDMASLLEDARRDVDVQTVKAAWASFLSLSGEAEQSALQRYAVLAAQRNMKIIGIFTRLCVRDGKPQYLNYLPRVWGHLMRDLEQPMLAEVKHFVDAHVPVSARGAIKADPSIGSVA